jgi:hypothetical protein
MELLQSGSTTIADVGIRALPARLHRIYITAVSATSVDISNNSDMSNPKNLVPATDQAFIGGTDIAAGFLRVNGGTAVVRLVKF